MIAHQSLYQENVVLITRIALVSCFFFVFVIKANLLIKILENTNKTLPVLSTTEASAPVEIPSPNHLGIQIKEITKSEEIRIVDEKQSTQSPDQKSTTREDEEEGSSFGSENENSIIPSTSPPLDIQQLQHFEDEDDDQSNPVNPAYPIINEEDLSIYPREQYEQEHQEPRSSSADNVKNKISKPDEREYLPMGRAPGEPCLIPEFERNTTKSCGSTTVALTSSEEIEEENGSGSDRDREQTTPKYVNLNIDELYSGSGDTNSSVRDPNNDVDVLKLDEEDNFSASGNTEVEKERGVAQFV